MASSWTTARVMTPMTRSACRFRPLRSRTVTAMVDRLRSQMARYAPFAEAVTLGVAQHIVGSYALVSADAVDRPFPARYRCAIDVSHRAAELAWAVGRVDPDGGGRRFGEVWATRRSCTDRCCRRAGLGVKARPTGAAWPVDRFTRYA